MRFTVCGAQRLLSPRHSTDLVETVRSLEIEHRKVDRAEPGDDVALAVEGHVHEHDLIFREP